MNEKDTKHLVAVHEAGHAVAHWLLGTGFERVEIHRDLEHEGNWRGGVEIPPVRTPGTWNKTHGQHIEWSLRKETELELVALLAGVAAEHVWLRKVTRCGQEDLGYATEIASENYPDCKEGADAYLRWALLHTQNLLGTPRNRRMVKQLAEELEANEELTHDQVERILRMVQGRYNREIQDAQS